MWGGRRAQRTVALVLATYGDVCHLCGHDAADSADHIEPRADGGPVWDVDNLRPVHHRPCPTCGLRCNVRRGARPVSEFRPVTDGTSYIDG